MSFLPLDMKAGLLVGIYLVNAIIPIPLIVFQWTASNIAGHTKRVAAVTLVTASFGIGSLIGPQTFQAKEAPGYRSAKITLVAGQASAAFLSFVLFLYYVWQNKKRDTKTRAVGDTAHIGQWENLTDKENATFRYVY